MRSAAMINVDVDIAAWQEQDREYVAMIVQLKAQADSSSYEPVTIENSPETRKPLTGMCTLHRSEIARPNRNTP